MKGTPSAGKKRDAPGASIRQIRDRPVRARTGCIKPWLLDNWPKCLLERGWKVTGLNRAVKELGDERRVTSTICFSIDVGIAPAADD